MMWCDKSSKNPLINIKGFFCGVNKKLVMTKKSIVFIDKRLYNCLYQDAVGDLLE